MVVGREFGRPSDAAAALMALLQDEPAEVFAILCLTTKHRVIAYHDVTRGTLDSVLVNPRLCWTEHKRGWTEHKPSYVAAVVMWDSGWIR